MQDPVLLYHAFPGERQRCSRKGLLPSFSWTGLLILLSLASCRKNLYQDKSLDNKLVILAEITAEETLKIPVSKSILVGSGSIITFEKVGGAKVTVTEEGSPPWNLPVNNSSLYASDPATVYTSPRRPVYEKAYDLRVEEPSLGVATARVEIPGPVTITHFDTSGELRMGNPVLKCHITVADPAGAPSFYIIEAVKQLLVTRHFFYWQGVRYDYDKDAGKKLYEQVRNNPGVSLLRDTVPTGKLQRLNIFTEDNNTDNAKVGSLDSVFERIFLPDDGFNGQSYSTTFSIERKYFKAGKPGDEGRVLIQFKSASPELYNYLFWYAQYKTDVGYIPSGQLYSPPGNIANGLGIFGGSSKRQWIYYFDPLW